MQSVTIVCQCGKTARLEYNRSRDLRAALKFVGFSKGPHDKFYCSDCIKAPGMSLVDYSRVLGD
jgi:hypothetical protein